MERRRRPRLHDSPPEHDVDSGAGVHMREPVATSVDVQRPGEHLLLWELGPPSFWKTRASTKRVSSTPGSQSFDGAQSGYQVQHWAHGPSKARSRKPRERQQTQDMGLSRPSGRLSLGGLACGERERERDRERDRERERERETEIRLETAQPVQTEVVQGPRQSERDCDLPRTPKKGMQPPLTPDCRTSGGKY